MIVHNQAERYEITATNAEILHINIGNIPHNFYIKKRILIFLAMIFLLLSSLQSYAQWERIKTLPKNVENNYWLEAYFLKDDPNYGWVSGYNGAVIRTTDGGITWKSTIIRDSVQFESIYFVDKNDGFVSGPDDHRRNDYFKVSYIYKTTDGGNTWKNISPPSNPRTGLFLWGHFFLNANNGLVIGDGCLNASQKFYRTTNGGNTWQLYEGLFSSTRLADLILYPSGLGYAVSSGYLWITQDGGQTWKDFLRTGGNDWQEDLHIYGNTILVPYSPTCEGKFDIGGGIRMSTDFGKSWRNYSTGQSMFGTFLLDSLRGWACGLKKSVYFTEDGGLHWELKNCGVCDTCDLDDFHFINDTTGFLVGEGVYRYKQPQSIDLHDKVICKGDTATLEVNLPFKSYKWSTGETTKSIKVTKPGRYWVTAIDSNNCHSDATCKIDLYPEVKISPIDTSVCEGDSLLFEVKPDFLSYQWSTGETSKTIMVSQKGIYQIVATDSNGCRSFADFKLSYFPQPNPILSTKGRENICVGDSVILITNDTSLSYNWFRNPGNEFISNNNSSYTIRNDGSYYVIAKNKYGCIGQSPVVQIIFRNDTNRLKIESISTGSEVNFDTLSYSNILCKKVQIKNISSKPFKFDNVYLIYNTSFSAPQSQFPIFLDTGQTVQIEVCYSPKHLGIERDTMLIPDVCSDHIIPLKGFSATEIFSGTNSCNILIKSKVKTLPNQYMFSAYEPYPNPANSVIHVPFEKYYNNEAATIEECRLYNSLGTSIGVSKTNVIEENNENGWKYQSGEYLVSTVGIGSGAYFLVINSSAGSQKFVIIIEE